MSLLTCLLLAFCVPAFSGLNILLWSPTYGQSHVNFMVNIADTLYDGGHNVTLLLVENDRDVRITNTPKVNVMRFSSSLVRDNEWSSLNFKKANIFYLRTFELSDYKKMESINRRICMLDDQEFLMRLRASKYDLLVLEMFHLCPAGIAHISGIRKIILSSALGMTMTHYEFTGLPITLSNTPAFLTEHGNRMTFPERVLNVLYYFGQKVLYLRMRYSEQIIFARRFENFPDLYELYQQKTDYILLNSNEFTDSVRPLTSSVKYIGGANIGQPKLLPKVCCVFTFLAMPGIYEFDDILGLRSRGVVLFSLGSLVTTSEMPLQVRSAFIEAFRAFPDYQFLWKDDIFYNSTAPNIHYKSWLPQIDLLADPRVKVFITHGGMNSIQESLFFGVPMIIMPIFADQGGNAALAEERGYALKISKFDVTAERVVEALRKILGEDGEESSFTLKARQASRLLHGSPARMREEILRVARFSGEESRLMHLVVNTDMPFYQYYNIDVYIYLAITSCLGTVLAIRLINSSMSGPSVSRFKKLLQCLFMLY